MDALVRIDDVTKRYDGDGPPAVDGVSFEIAAGESVAIMGPSGSGKSTLLNLIAGLDRPSSGEVTVAGERIDRLSETAAARFRRQRVGMIFQFFNLLEDLTVLDNVLLPAQFDGMRAAEGPGEGGRAARSAWHRAPPRRLPGTALGRRASARRDRQGTRQPPGAAARRRADRRARQRGRR